MTQARTVTLNVADTGNGYEMASYSGEGGDFFPCCFSFLL